MAKQILIYGAIGYDWWTGGGITGASFKKEFDEAIASGEEIEILINSPGGSVFEGINIYNTIVKSEADVTTIIDGIAYSMGAVIAMAGKNRKAYKNTSIMMHNCSGGAYGNANDLRGALEMMEVLDKNLVTSIAQITGLSEKEVTDNWFDYRDHTLTAADALTAGLLTELIDVNSEGVPANVGAMTKIELFAHYGKQQTDEKQSSFVNQIANTIAAKLGVKPSVEITSDKNLTDDMKIKITSKMVALAAILAVSFADGQTEQEVEITSEQFEKISAKMNEMDAAITAANDAKVKADADLVTANARITELEGKASDTEGDPNASDEAEGSKKKTTSLSIKAPVAGADDEKFNYNY